MISLKIESKPKFILLLIRLRCSELATRSDDTEPEIGIERKKIKPTIL